MVISNHGYLILHYFKYVGYNPISIAETETALLSLSLADVALSVYVHKVYHSSILHMRYCAINWWRVLGLCGCTDRELWLSFTCGVSWAMSHGGAHPSPCQTTADNLHLGGSPWSRTCGLNSSRIMHPGRWLHRGSSYAHTQMPCQHPSLWFSRTGLQGSRRLWRAGLSSSRTE